MTMVQQVLVAEGACPACSDEPKGSYWQPALNSASMLLTPPSITLKRLTLRVSIQMKKEDVLKQYTTPTGAPAFVPGPHRFTSREYLNITYRTDRDALAKQVPEPLEVDEPLVRFEVMNMPDTTGYGSYVECGQAAVVRHGDEVGEYIIGMYLDNLPAIAAGRELSAFPKKLGSAKLFVDSDTLVGTLDYGTLSVARATMGYKHKPMDLEKARQEICVPTFMLKILPSYEKRPRICELVRTEITNNWLERYNEIRPHDALGSLPPARYREHLLAAETPV